MKCRDNRGTLGAGAFGAVMKQAMCVAAVGALTLEPMLTPVLVTVAILNFMGSWSDFIHPLYFLNNSDKWPMTLAVYNFFGRFQVNWNLVSADIVLTTLPVIVIYLLGQRFIISGMTAGSVKG